MICERKYFYLVVTLLLNSSLHYVSSHMLFAINRISPAQQSSNARLVAFWWDTELADSHSEAINVRECVGYEA